MALTYVRIFWYFGGFTQIQLIVEVEQSIISDMWKIMLNVISNEVYFEKSIFRSRHLNKSNSGLDAKCYLSVFFKRKFILIVMVGYHSAYFSGSPN